MIKHVSTSRRLGGSDIGPRGWTPLLLTACLVFAGSLSVRQADAQVAVPEAPHAALSGGGAGTVQAPATATPRQMAWFKATPAQRTVIAEELGEEGARGFARARGWTPYLDGSDRTLRQGLDQVWKTPDGSIRVIEAKGGGSPLGKGYGYEQGTPEWAVKAAERVVQSDKASVVEKKAAVEVLKAAKSGRLEVLVVRTRHILGEATVAVLESTKSSTRETIRLATVVLDKLSLAKGVAEGAEAGANAAKSVAKVLRPVARYAPLVGTAVDVAVRVNSAADVERRYRQGEIDERDREIEHAENVAGMAGGWSGAVAGLELGAAGGGAVGGVPGAAVGGLVGGVGGYVVGEKAAQEAAGWVVHQVQAPGTMIFKGTVRAWSATSGAASSAWRWATN